MQVRKYDGGHAIPPHFLTKRPLDRDKLSMVSRDDAARGAHLALFQLQDIAEPEIIVGGIAVLFAALCLRCNLDPHDLNQIGKRILYAPDDGDHVTGNSLQVLRDLISGRVAGQQVTIG